MENFKRGQIVRLKKHINAAHMPAALDEVKEKMMKNMEEPRSILVIDQDGWIKLGCYFYRPEHLELVV